MDRPRFDIGQLVAMCDTEAYLVIPRAKVLECRYFDNSGELYTSIEGDDCTCFEGWHYRLDGLEPDIWAREGILRPIDDDEYNESEELMDSLKKPSEVRA